MKFSKFENGSLVEYNFSTLEDLKSQVEEWKKEFREKNKTDKVIRVCGKDSSYERYCEQLENLIKKYKEF